MQHLPPFEQRFYDQLRAIEGALAAASTADPALTDLHAAQALDAAARRYSAQAKGRPAPAIKLAAPAQAALEHVQAALAPSLAAGLAFEDAAACAKRILRAAEQWRAAQGPRGFLAFVRQYSGG